jgi:hypothetical protein
MRYVPLDVDHTQASTPGLAHTPLALHLDNDDDDNRSSSSTCDAAHTFDNNNTDNNSQSNIDATSLISAACFLNTDIVNSCNFNAARITRNTTTTSSHHNASDADADTLDNNSGTDITPPIHTSISTGARDNEPEPEDKDKHARGTPPLKVSTQVPLVAPRLDKPEELPPHWTRADAIDNSSISNIVRSNEPEHECTRTPPLEARTQVPPAITPPPDMPEEPPPARPMDKAASPPTLKVVQHPVQHIS